MTGWDDFTVEQTRGDDHSFQFTLTDSAGDPIDLTGYTGLRYLAAERVEDDDADAVIDLTVGAGITVTDAEAGVLDFEVPAAQTSGLGDRRHQLLALLRGDNPSAKRKTLRRGVHTVWPT